MQIIGNEVHHEGFRVAILEQGGVPPTVMDRAVDLIEGADKSAEIDELSEQLTAAERATKKAIERLEEVIKNLEDIADDKTYGELQAQIDELNDILGDLE